MASCNEGDVERFMRGECVHVISSNVDTIQYDSESRDLRVKFLSSPTVYRYLDVPPGLAEDLALVESKGTWVSTVLVKQRWGFVKE